MFRYIALSWSAYEHEQREAARRLDQCLRTTQGWQCVQRTEGLHVYVTGNCPGVNDTYPLPSGRGVILGRLFRRSGRPETASDIELTSEEAHQIVHTDGQELTQEFWGRYVAFLPSWTGEGRVLRDPTGTLPCFQTRVNGICIVFSWLEDLLDVLQLSPKFTVDWDAVAILMLRGHLGGRDTALKEVKQVLPGELTTLGDQPSSPLVLWSAVDVSSRPTEHSVADAAEQLRQIVNACALSWASCYGPILLRLSGGIDSSILLSSLRAIPSERIACINYHSPGSDSDERGYARLAASRTGARLIEQHRDDSFRLESVLDVARTPTPGSYLGRMGTGRMDAAAAAAHDARAVFTGSSGDQVFFERRCTWPAADYLKLHGFGRGFLGAALDAARLGQVSFWRAIGNAVKDQSFRDRPATEIGRYVTLASPEARERASQELQRAMHPALLAADELPIGKYHQVDDLISPGEYYDPYLRDASPELVTPLRSQPLVEFCLAMPTYTLAEGGRGRGLARRAFANDIPPEIAARRSKGSNQDHVASVLRRNASFARELLLDGQLAKQGLLDRAQLDAALSGKPTATQTYVAEIHTCIAIESWIRRFN